MLPHAPRQTRKKQERERTIRSKWTQRVIPQITHHLVLVRNERDQGQCHKKKNTGEKKSA